MSRRIFRDRFRYIPIRKRVVSSYEQGFMEASVVASFSVSATFDSIYTSASDSFVFTATATQLTSGLQGQWDINTRGRTDNDFYEHINGTVESSTGTTLDTSRGYAAMSYDTNDYTISSFPASLAANFADNNFTIAVRFQQDDTAGGTQSLVFAADASDTGTRTGTYLDTSADRPYAQKVGAGTDLYFGDLTGVGTAEQVLVFRREGPTNHDLWLDDTEVETNTSTTPGNHGSVYDQIVFGKYGALNTFYLQGDIIWVGIWDRALTDAEIQLLNDDTNPFWSNPATGDIAASDSFAFAASAGVEGMVEAAVSHTFAFAKAGIQQDPTGNTPICWEAETYWQEITGSGTPGPGSPYEGEEWHWTVVDVTGDVGQTLQLLPNANGIDVGSPLPENGPKAFYQVNFLETVQTILSL